MTTPDSLQFKISQLRSAQILAAIEMVAAVLTACMIILLINYFFTGLLVPVVIASFAVVSVVFVIFKSIGNIQRQRKIASLERQLER